MDKFDEVPDWANPDYKRRRRLLFVLLGIGLAALAVGLYFLFTH
jgi:hypothetical protein